MWDDLLTGEEVDGVDRAPAVAIELAGPFQGPGGGTTFGHRADG